MKQITFVNLTESPVWEPHSESFKRCTLGDGPPGSIWDVWAVGLCEWRRKCKIANTDAPHARKVVLAKDIDFTQGEDRGGEIERRFVVLLPDQNCLSSADLLLIEVGLAKILEAIDPIKPSVDYQNSRSI